MRGGRVVVGGEGRVLETLTHAHYWLSLKPAEACSFNRFAKKP